MLKRRNPVIIGKVGEFNSKMGLELHEAKIKLKNDVDSILEIYKGIDATVTIGKFDEDIEKLDSIIRNLEYYGGYMKNVSSYDRENLHHTKQQFSSITPASKDLTSSENHLELVTFNLNNIGGDTK